MVAIPTGFVFISEKIVVKIESGQQMTVFQAASNEELGWLATDRQRVYWLLTSNDNKTFRTVKSVIYSVSLDHHTAAIRSGHAVKGQKSSVAR